MEVGEATGTGRSENNGEEAKEGNGHEIAQDREKIKIATPNSIRTCLADIRDPDSYIIEVGQSTNLTYG